MKKHGSASGVALFLAFTMPSTPLPTRISSCSH